MVSRAHARKVPAYSIYSEKVLLGSMLADPALAKPVADILGNSEAFFRVENARIFDALIELCNRHSPSTTEDLFHALQAHGKVETLGGENALRDLVLDKPKLTDVLEHANTILSKHKMRNFIDAMSDSLNDAYHSTDGYIAVIKRTRERLAKLESAGE